MKPAQKFALIGNLVFPLLVLLIILMGKLAELLDSRENLLNIWEAPSLVEITYDLKYYKCFLEKGKKLIMRSERKNSQGNGGNQLESRTRLRTVYLNNFYKKLGTINYNETICCKIFLSTKLLVLV